MLHYPLCYRVSAITRPDRTGAKVYYQSGPDFSSSVTYPAMGMSPLLPECYDTIDNPGNVTKSPELV